MKRILVTGTNGYIGSSLQKWISGYFEEYQVNMLSVKGEDWKRENFSKYDVIFHAAAIVHIKENDKNKYYSINRDLTIDLALKAKREGVKQFIFLSTMAVYGEESGCINKHTLPNPSTHYGKSKYEAEQFLLNQVSDELFRVAILRPPMVYGRECPGNYGRLAAIAKRLPIFPKVNNERSMIYIDNLTEFIRLLIQYNAQGIFFPQNQEYVNTAKMVKNIAKIHKKSILIIPYLDSIITLASRKSSTFRKVFGTLKYSKDMNGAHFSYIEGKLLNYEMADFEKSIKLTEGGQL